MVKNLENLEKELEVVFKNKDLIKSALVHRSYLNEHKNFVLDHNERLEFLGDAVLELVVTDHLFHNYPNPEGDLTNWRSSLVNRERLSAQAEKLNLYSYLHMSREKPRMTIKKRAVIFWPTLLKRW